MHQAQALESVAVRKNVTATRALLASMQSFQVFRSLLRRPGEDS